MNSKPGPSLMVWLSTMTCVASALSCFLTLRSSVGRFLVRYCEDLYHRVLKGYSETSRNGKILSLRSLGRPSSDGCAMMEVKALKDSS